LVNFANEQFQCRNLDVEKVDAEHRNQIVHHPLVKDVRSLLGVSACDVVIGLEVDPKRFLQDRGDPRVELDRDGQGTVVRNKLHKNFIILLNNDELPDLRKIIWAENLLFGR
jgi:hypothetical protein